MGLLKKKSKTEAVAATPEPPKLAHRVANRHSAMKSGRTIGERREKLETSNERLAARKQAKRQKRLRVFFVSIGFIILMAILAIVYFVFFEKREEVFPEATDTEVYAPTIEVVDEDAAATSGKITSRMSEYIGQVEAEFRALGYQPTKAVLPTNSIREVDFYLDGHNGYIKMITDRSAAVSVEDADRMLHYLAGQGITNFSYIDVRISGKAYWK